MNAYKKTGAFVFRLLLNAVLVFGTISLWAGDRSDSATQSGNQAPPRDESTRLRANVAEDAIQPRRLTGNVFGALSDVELYKAVTDAAGVAVIGVKEPDQKRGCGGING